MTMSRARSRSMPLCLRRSCVRRGEPLAQLRVGRGRAAVAAEMSTPEQPRRAAGSPRLSPSSVRSATPRRSSDVGGLQDPLVVALGQHDVPAVGDGPVDQLVLEHQRRDRAACARPRAGRAARRGRRAARTAPGPCPPCAASPCAAGRGPTSAPAWSRWCRGRSRRSASCAPRPSISRLHLLRQLEAAVEDDPGHLREVRATPARSAPRGPPRAGPPASPRPRRRRAGRARAASSSPPTTTPVVSWRQQRRLAAHQGAVARGHQVGHRGRVQQRLLGEGERRYAEGVPAPRPPRRGRPVEARLATTANSVPWLALQLADGEVGHRAHLLGRAVEGVEHEQDRGCPGWPRSWR